MIDESCIFCKIVRKQAPSSIIYEDEAVMVFLDIRPLNMGHTLVIPKAHSDGISIIQQNGKAAGQDIFHIHVHVVPRYEGQKLPPFHELKEVERAKLDEMAKKIKLLL